MAPVPDGEADGAVKGLTWLADDRLHLSCADFGEVYTGGYDWEDYAAIFHIRPECPGSHMVNVRVKGAIRSYAAGFYAPGKFGFYKNQIDHLPLDTTGAMTGKNTESQPVVGKPGEPFEPGELADFPLAEAPDLHDGFCQVDGIVCRSLLAEIVQEHLEGLTVFFRGPFQEKAGLIQQAVFLERDGKGDF